MPYSSLWEWPYFFLPGDQFIANGIIAGSKYALVAVGFGLIFFTLKFFHFAHGAVLAVAAYTALALSLLAWPPLLGAAVAIGVATVFGVVMEAGVYRPLRRKGATPLVLLVASLGLYIVTQGTLALIFGHEARVIEAFDGVSRVHILNARFSTIQLATIVSGVLGTLLVAYVLRGTSMGRTIRAIADDENLAHVVGASRYRVVVFVFALGSALASLAGVLHGYDVDLAPTIGFHLLLMGVTAAIVGGIGNVYGAFLGGIMVGLAEHLSVIWIPSKWKDAVVFVILILFLVLRPQGLFGKKPPRTY